MELKTIEEILKSKGITPESKHHSYEYLYKSVIDSYREYTMQEVERYLEIAADEAKLIIGDYRMDRYDINDGFIEEAIFVDKESITNIKIELT